jgi:hypothetical protein
MHSDLTSQRMLFPGQRPFVHTHAIVIISGAYEHLAKLPMAGHVLHKDVQGWHGQDGSVQGCKMPAELNPRGLDNGCCDRGWPNIQTV